MVPCGVRNTIVSSVVASVAALSATAGVASISGVTFTGVSDQVRVIAGGETAAGSAVALAAQETCEELDWLPTFGGLPGISGPVVALAVLDDGLGGGPALYAGGQFSAAGGVDALRVAKWNGSTWSPLGDGLGDFGKPVSVATLAAFDDGLGGGPALYAGGSFTTAGGTEANRIARWNPATQTWSPLGTGMNDWVYDIEVFDDGSGAGPALYAAGEFTSAGGNVANRLARWNPSLGSWSPLESGTDDAVWVLAVFDDGSGGGPALYAGGEFMVAGGVATSRIAKWNGSSWSPLGSGMNNQVRTLTVFDDGLGGGPALYAGGNFTTAGGEAAHRLAKWNGSIWSPVGTGFNQLVHALAVYDDGLGDGAALYAAGAFGNAGGVNCNRIARWNPAAGTWSPLGSGMLQTVWALAVLEDGVNGGPAIVAGGDFSTAGDETALRVAEWNGSDWSPLGGSGLNGVVRAVAVFDDGLEGSPGLYAGGSFSGLAANRIVRWSFTEGTWSPLGTGTIGTVHALAVFDDGLGRGPALYVGGGMSSAGGVVTKRIARWDPSTQAWSPLGSGFDNGDVWALEVFDDGLGGGPALYAGGTFTTAGGVAVNRIARWNPASETWSPLGSGLSSQVRCLTVFDDGIGSGPALYAGGAFASSGGVAVNRIARWNPASGTWSPLGSGIGNGEVRCLTVLNSGVEGGPSLFAGGTFTTAGGVTSNYIAHWNPALGTWSPLGEGVNYFVYALAASHHGLDGGPEIYAGGALTAADGAPASRVVRWFPASETWSPLGDGVNAGVVETLEVYADGVGDARALIVGGSFVSSPGGDSYLAAWGCEGGPRPPCEPADLDCDGIVNGADLAIVLGNWGSCVDCPADINNDGVIDGADLAIVLGNWTG